MANSVRINGNSTERVGKFAVWAVEIFNDAGEWVMVASMYGPAAVSVARDWRRESIPSPLDAFEFIEEK